MKLQQLRAFCVVVDENMSVSRAARVLFTTQPAVSKQIRQLEDSLGATLLIRAKSRILGLTDVGRDVLQSARTMMAATQDIEHIVDDHRNQTRGRLAIATTHTHARYALQDSIPAFARQHPEVALHIVQATPNEIADLVVTGQVDIGISTAPRTLPATAVTIPCFEFKHILVGERGHPLFKRQQVTLEDIAQYPLITYSEQHAIGRRLIEAFDAAGLTPKVAVRGTDVEVMKYYASTGLGLAVIPLIAYSKTLDRKLAARPVDHLFQTSTVYVVARRGAYWPRHLYEFVGTLSPTLSRDKIEEALLSAVAAS
jgi:DNA-binding transcriptional LysR family regulator